MAMAGERVRQVGVVTAAIVMLATACALSSIGHAGSPVRLAQAAPKAAGAPATSRPPPTVLVFFDFEKSALVQSARPLLDRIAELFKSTSAKEVRIVAHTDAAEANSEALSLARGSTLRAGLIARGIPAHAIAIVGAGATLPLVPTAKGTKEPQNRRAEVALVP